MYAITVKQPWAEAIARHGKHVENRSRRPPAHLLGHRIAIHVSQASDAMQHMRAAATAPEDHLWELDIWAAHSLDLVPGAGRIIATARLIGWCSDKPIRAESKSGDTRSFLRYTHDEDSAAAADAVYDAHCSAWFTGPVGWVLADVRPLWVPVGWPCTAFQGIDTPGLRPGQVHRESCPRCSGDGVSAIRGQVYPFLVPTNIEAAVLAAEIR
jgi:hypothetical protein